MGLESHATFVIEKSDPDRLLGFWWCDGLNVENKETAEQIMEILDESKEFGPTKYNKKNQKIEFGEYKND